MVLGDGLLIKKSLENSSQVKNIVPAHPVFSMPRASSIAAALQNISGRCKSCFSINPFT